MGTKFKDYVEQVEAGLSPEGQATLETFREHYSIAQQLLSLRREQQLTQSALAERTGIPQSEISRIERGSANPTQATLQALAHGLGRELGFVRRGEPLAH